MFKKVYTSVFALFVLLSSQFAAADEQFPALFQSAMSHGKTGNGFAAAPTCTTGGGTTTCTSPYGGTVTQNYSQWTGSSGTTTWSYNSFTISVAGITMILNGSFTYTGSVSQTGLLDGTMTGTLNYAITTPGTSYGGYTLPAMTQNMSIGLNAVFSNGNATVTLSIDGKAQGTVSWSQTQLLGYLY